MSTAIFSQVKIPVIVFQVQTKLFHTLYQDVITFLTLASANQFTDARYQHIHSGHGFIVIVEAHIECFDLFWIIGDKNRHFVNLLCQISLMLCLQITAPVDRIFKFILVLFQNLNRFCIGNLFEISSHQVVQTLYQSLIIEIIEEFHFLWAGIQYIFDDILQHIPCKSHAIVKICKCDFRFYHPEFRCMTGSIAVFCTESWSKRIHLSKSHRHAFCF